MNFLAGCVSSDPTAAYDQVSVIEAGGLARCDRALRLGKGHQYFVWAHLLQHGGSAFMTMPDLHSNPHRLAPILHRNQIHPAGAEGSRIEIVDVAHYHLALVALDLDNIEGRTRGYAQALALAYGEIVDAVVLADHLS